MKLYILFFILITLAGCSGGGSGGDTLENISSQITKDNEDLDDVARVLEDELNFEYKINEIDTLDFTSQAKLGPSYADENNNVFKIIFQQFKLNSKEFGPLKLYEISVNGNVSLIANITEVKQVTRVFRLHNQIIYETINPSELKVYNPNTELVSKLQNIYTESNTKRRINRFKNYNDVFCGTLNENNTFFHLKINTSTSPFSSKFAILENNNGDLKSWECNENFFAAYSKNGQIIKWSIQNNSSELTNPNSMNCSPEKFIIIKRNNEIFLRCSNLNENNKWVHQYLNIEYSNDSALSSLPSPPAKQEHQFYRFNLDLNSSDYQNKKTIVYYKYKNEEWQVMELDLESIPVNIDKIQASIDDTEFYVSTNRGLTRMNIKTKNKQHTTLPYAWLKIWSDSQDHILFQNAEVYSFDKLFEENHFQNFVINRSSFTDNLKWNPIEKIKLSGSYQIVDNDIYYLEKNGKFHRINHQLQLQAVLKTFPLIGSYNWKIQDDRLFIFTNGNADNGFFKSLIKYDIKTDQMETISLGISTKRNYQFKLKDNLYLLYSTADIRGYSLLDHSKKFEFGFKHRGSPFFLPNGKIILLLDNKVQILDPEKVTLNELYQFEDVTLFNRVKSFHFADTTMLIRDGSDKLKTLRIPFGKIHMKDNNDTKE